MRLTSRTPACMTAALCVSLLGATVAGQNGSQFREWKASTIKAAPVGPHAACASLVGLTGFELSVTTASIVAASTDAPEFCRVSGQIQPEIRFEVGEH